MSVPVLLFGGVYIAAQSLSAVHFTGRWRIAAFVPIPALMLLAIGAVLAAVLGGADSTALIMLGLPIATVYLTVLAALHLIVRTATRPRTA
jgi:hypothetical protein